MSEAVIKFEHVSKEYFLYKNEKARFKAIFTNNKGVKRHQALKDISFEVHKGESVGIIGRNGAGKSTLMSMLFGMYEPDEGEIYVKGRKVRITSPF